MTARDGLLFAWLSWALASGSAMAEPRAVSECREIRLGVAIVQPLVLPGAVDKNVSNMEPLVIEAARRGATLAVFSECGITGYDLEGAGANAAMSLDDPRLDRVARMAGEHHIAIVAGLHERLNDKLHNSAVVFFPDGRRIVQRKHLIMPAEQAIRPIVPADRTRTLFDVDGFRCAVLICSDAGIDGIYDRLAEDGCDAVILLAAGAGNERFGYHQADLEKPEPLRRYLESALVYISPQSVQLSLRLNLAQVAVNQAGWDPETGYFHPGGSSIVNRTGEVTAVIPPRFVFEHLRPDLSVGFISKRRGGQVKTGTEP